MWMDADDVLLEADTEGPSGIEGDIGPIGAGGYAALSHRV